MVRTRASRTDGLSPQPARDFEATTSAGRNRSPCIEARIWWASRDSAGVGRGNEGKGPSVESLECCLSFLSRRVSIEGDCVDGEVGSIFLTLEGEWEGSGVREDDSLLSLAERVLGVRILFKDILDE